MFKANKMSSSMADIAQESFAIPSPWPPQIIEEPVRAMDIPLSHTMNEEMVQVGGNDLAKRPAEDLDIGQDSDQPPDKRARLEEHGSGPSTVVESVPFPEIPIPRGPTPSTSRAVVEYVNPVPHHPPGIVPPVIGVSPAVSRLFNGVVPNKENADKIMKQYSLEHGNIRIIDFYRDIIFANRGITGNDRHDLARHEMAVIAKAETAFLNKIPFGANLCNEIVNVSDDTFDLILSRHADISVTNINMITTYAWAQYAEGELRTDNKRKFIAIARYGLLPKLVGVGSNIRNLFTSYEKLVAIDQDLVMDHLLIPLLDTTGSIPKPLYHGVDTHKFLTKLLDRMSTSFTTLTDGNMIPTLSFLIDKEREYLQPPASLTLFKVLEISLQTRSTDTKVAHFYHLILKKFCYTMSDAEVKQLHGLNYYNQTFLKESVDKLVDERLRSQRHILDKTLISKPTVYRSDEPISLLRREQDVVFRHAKDGPALYNGEGYETSMEIDE